MEEEEEEFEEQQEVREDDFFDEPNCVDAWETYLAYEGCPCQEDSFYAGADWANYQVKLKLKKILQGVDDGTYLNVCDCLETLIKSL